MAPPIPTRVLDSTADVCGATGASMSDPLATLPPTTLERMAKRTEIPFAVAVVGIIGILVLPLPTGLLSVLLATNLSLAMVVLLVTLNTREPLEFNTFPSLLLITTLFRLGLNVATTRQILLNGEGGAIIESFGNFVVGGNIVVGLVIFLILIIIQLVVITKGAGRVSEVAARFTLDAMPGKQMAIDADLNAGLISETEAKERRAKISAEAEFYGSMDGASKFVKGDAIAGLIITAINLVAGIIIGMSLMGMDFSRAIETFSILTVGDGLVSALPSLLIAIASGLLVTKARSEENIGQEVPKQMVSKSKGLIVAACMVLGIGLVPGMPFIPFAIIGTALLIIWSQVRNVESEEKTRVVELAQQAQDQSQAEEKVEDNLTADRIGVEIGYRLIPLVDKERGGTLLDRITKLRKQLARENGLLIPPIRIKDNIQLGPNVYRITIYGEEVARGELVTGRLLAIDGGSVAAPIEGLPTKEPAFGLDALWIEEGRRAEAEALGYAVTDPASVFITHLTQLLRSQAHLLLNREDVQAMLESLKRESPVLVKEIEENVKLGKVQKVIASLLEEKVPVHNLEKILEAVSDLPDADPTMIAEVVRSKLGRAVISPFLNEEGKLSAVILHPVTEQRLAQSVNGGKQGGGIGIAPAEASQLMDRLGKAQSEGLAAGLEPVLLVTAGLRKPMRQITSRFFPDLAVISYSELPPGTDVNVVATLDLHQNNADQRAEG
ncbi:MAG: flagellar biosynthesis protein FlhA [Planctomycetota bacterium]|nr:MAG: flagellar biosynthesis protein FlhA [Planctomycetota bacterium]